MRITIEYDETTLDKVAKVVIEDGQKNREYIVDHFSYSMERKVEQTVSDDEDGKIPWVKVSPTGEVSFTFTGIWS